MSNHLEYFSKIGKDLNEFNHEHTIKSNPIVIKSNQQITHDIKRGYAIKASIKDHTTSSLQSSEENVGVVSHIYITKNPP